MDRINELFQSYQDLFHVMNEEIEGELCMDYEMELINEKDFFGCDFSGNQQVFMMFLEVVLIISVEFGLVKTMFQTLIKCRCTYLIYLAAKNQAQLLVIFVSTLHKDLMYFLQVRIKLNISQKPMN